MILTAILSEDIIKKKGAKEMKKWFLLIGILLPVLLVLALSLVPGVSYCERIAIGDVSEVEVPELVRSYQELCDENSLSVVRHGAEVEVVKVRNFWGNCEYYVLPCYITDICDVSTAGSLNWDTSLRVLIVCSDEDSLAARLCRWQVRDLNVRLEPGENTFLYDMADIDPFNLRVGSPENISIDQRINVIKNPEIRIRYTTATGKSDLERDMPTEAVWSWDYSLWCCGMQIQQFRNVSLSYDYLVNT